ncbi:MAG TPA: hypothetical protein ENK65_02285 [Helicobacteraceae bacterium]|nr:hypothetical protein [Helicobacteraceae bacterium]
MRLDPNKKNIYVTTVIILAGLVFMLVSGIAIIDDVGNSSSVEISIDQKVDACYEREGLE